jgi:hypothetical protein
MKAIRLSVGTASDIDSQVEKVIRGLGHPEPPLDLRIVRDHLDLNREYYRRTDESSLRETVGRIRVAGRQVLRRPTLLFDAIRKFSLQALYLPDQKRILLDQDVPVLKHRWNEAHEIGHSLVPWHAELLHGDDEQTLTLACREALETEANFAAGQLLFLRDRFVEEARSRALGFKAVQELHGLFGNTLSSTLWRYVEQADPTRPIFGMISAHPHPERRRDGFDPLHPCRHMMQSPAFAEKFSKISEVGLFTRVVQYAGPQRGGMLGAEEVTLADDAENEHLFRFETFYNGYDALTLGWYLRPRRILVVRA